MSEQADGKFSEDPEVAAVEREAIEALAATARRFVTRLPSISVWRDPLISISDLDADSRQRATEARRQETY